MSRRTAAFFVLLLASAGIAVIAGDKIAETKTSDRETISFVATKSDEGSAVQITIGDWVLITPKLTMNSKSGKDNVEIIAQDERVVFKRSRPDYVMSAKEVKISLQAPLSGRIP